MKLVIRATVFIVFYLVNLIWGKPTLVEPNSEVNNKNSEKNDPNKILGQNLISFDLSALNSTVFRNNTPKNLYVVKAVVYEIGILTEVGENDTTSDETRERVDLTFYDAHSNDSFIDLGNIPLPVQTNITGQVLTGIAPVNIGAFSNPAELLQSLPLTGTIVNITHSETAYFKLTTNNLTKEEEPHVLKPGDIWKIPQIADNVPARPSSLPGNCSRSNSSL